MFIVFFLAVSSTSCRLVANRISFKVFTGASFVSTVCQVNLFVLDLLRVSKTCTNLECIVYICFVVRQYSSLHIYICTDYIYTYITLARLRTVVFVPSSKRCTLSNPYVIGSFTLLNPFKLSRGLGRSHAYRLYKCEFAYVHVSVCMSYTCARHVWLQCKKPGLNLG